jgi:hypothetical protein
VKNLVVLASELELINGRSEPWSWTPAIDGFVPTQTRGPSGQFGYIAKQLADLDSVLDLKRTALFSICFIAAR